MMNYIPILGIIAIELLVLIYKISWTNEYIASIILNLFFDEEEEENEEV